VRRATVLYDRDCGLCRTVMGAVLACDRRRRLRPVALQDPEARELLPGLSEEERMASFHLVEPDRSMHSAGAALARLPDYLPGGSPLAGAAQRRPALIERAYGLVAGNRDCLGPLIPAPLKRRATSVIDSRA